MEQWFAIVNEVLNTFFLLLYIFSIPLFKPILHILESVWKENVSSSIYLNLSNLSLLFRGRWGQGNRCDPNYTSKQTDLVRQRPNVSAWRESDTLMKYSIKRPQSTIRNDRDSHQKGVFTSLHREIIFGSSKNLSVKEYSKEPFSIIKNIPWMLQVLQWNHRWFSLIVFACVTALVLVGSPSWLFVIFSMSSKVHMALSFIRFAA